MAGGGGNIESGEPDFQIAPMIDVLLVMLIFFMTITSAQVLRVDKNIQLPVAPNAQKKDTGRSEAIINVRWDEAAKKGGFTFQDRPYDVVSEFVSDLRAVRDAAVSLGAEGKALGFRVVIRADRDVPALYVAQAMRAAAEAGVADISFSTANR